MINAFSEKNSNIDFLLNDYILQFRQMINEDNIYLSAVCIEILYQGEEMSYICNPIYALQ